MKRSLAILSLAALMGCAAEKPPAPTPPLVRTLIVGTTAGDAHRSYAGEVRARHEATLGFRVGGKIVARLVDVGAVVKPGQALARLDGSDLALQTRQAEANRAFAVAESQRFHDLKARNFVSQAALDAKENALAVANAQTALNRNQEAYAVLRADKAGVIAQVFAEPGQVVTAGQGVFRLAQSSELEIAISLPEERLAGLRPGANAEIALWAGGQPLRGRLRELAPMADAATRTFAARIALVDRDPRVALGMSATVRFDSEKSEILTIPLAAVYQRDGRNDDAAVWLVDADETLRLLPIAIAGYTDAGARVASGLVGGERIVAAGVHKLTAGQKVRRAEASR